MAQRSRNAALLLKIESVEGVAEVPSAATDAVLVENPRIRLTPQNVNTDEVTGSLDDRGPIVGGIQATITGRVWLHGSGVPETPPEWGDLLKICGWAEVITAAAVPAAPEALAAGGSTTLANLGVSAAATLQLYRGMPISFTGVVTLDTFMSDYQASKAATIVETASGALVATTSYQIPKNVLYKPASTSIPTATANLFIDGLKYVLAGLRGNFTFAITAGGALALDFTLTGMFVSKTDVAVPAATYDATRPPIWKGGRSWINRLNAACATWNFNNGMTLVYPENPAAAEGFDPTIHTRREMAGSLDPQMTLVATRNNLADLQAGTQRIANVRWGTAAGNRFGFTIPAALFTRADPEDRSGVATEGLDYSCIGQDAGAFICHF